METKPKKERSIRDGGGGGGGGGERGRDNTQTENKETNVNRQSKIVKKSRNCPSVRVHIERHLSCCEELVEQRCELAVDLFKPLALDMESSHE